MKARWARKTNRAFLCLYVLYVPKWWGCSWSDIHIPKHLHWQIEEEVYFSLLFFCFSAIILLLFSPLTWFVSVECVLLSEHKIHWPLAFLFAVVRHFPFGVYEVYYEIHLAFTQFNRIHLMELLREMASFNALERRAFYFRLKIRWHFSFFVTKFVQTVSVENSP